MLQSKYIHRLSQILVVKEEALIIELKKIKNINKDSYRGPALTRGSTLKKINPTEKLLINLMLRECDLVNQIKLVLNVDDFHMQKMETTPASVLRVLEYIMVVKSIYLEIFHCKQLLVMQTLR